LKEAGQEPDGGCRIGPLHSVEAMDGVGQGEQHAGNNISSSCDWNEILNKKILKV
jgi:hypothetical protein